MAEVLRIEDLHVSFDTYAGEVRSVRGVSFHVNEGEVLAVVGESGCGKSVTAKTIMKLNPMPPARIKQGTISLCGTDIVALRKRDAGNTGTDGQYDFPRSHDLYESYHEGGQTNNGNFA